MTIRELLEGLKFDGRISIRYHGKYWFEYLAFDYSEKLIKRYGDLVVKKSCILDGNLILYVKKFKEFSWRL